MKNESDEELRRIIKDKMPSATKEYISQGLKALGADQADYHQKQKPPTKL